MVKEKQPVRIHPELYQIIKQIKEVESKKIGFPISFSNASKKVATDYENWSTFFFKKIKKEDK